MEKYMNYELISFCGRFGWSVRLRPFARHIPAYYQGNTTVRQIARDDLPAAISPEAEQQNPQEQAVRHDGDSFRWLAGNLAPDRLRPAINRSKGVW